MDILKANNPYMYVQGINLNGGTEVLFHHRMHQDFYLYEIAGVPSAGAGVTLKLDIENTSRGIRYMSEPTRAALCAVQVPGGSAWLHPVLLGKGDLIAVRAVNRSGAANVTTDLVLVGYHHLGGIPEECAKPVEELYHYNWDFGDSIAAGLSVRKTIEVVSGKDFIGLGWVATDNAAAINTMTFEIVNESTGYRWMNTATQGFALWGSPTTVAKRMPFAQPIRLTSDQVVAITARNTTGGAVTDVAVAMYGYHVPAGGAEV